MWHMKRDMYHVTRDTWHMTRDMWHMEGAKHSLKISGLLQFESVFEIFKQKDDRLT